MAIVSEALQTLRMNQFMETSDPCEFTAVDEAIKEMIFSITNCKTDSSKSQTVANQWKELSTLIESTYGSEKFKRFRENGRKNSDQFAFWDEFVETIYPPLRDLNRSHREGDWFLHLSAIRRSLPLSFAFDRVNYKRWLPIYFDDCLKLEEKFPLIYKSFKEGDFVVKLTKRKASAIPIDQALESKYNKPAKSSSGVIGFTRRKEAVSKWGLIKHEKMRYSAFLRSLCEINDEDEHSLHHDFASKRNENDKAHVDQLITYIAQRGMYFR